MDLPACQVIPTARKGETGVSWTERLNRAYDQLPFDYLITFQEDYFLDAPVRHDCLMELLKFMVDSSADRLGLTHFGCRGPFEPIGSRDDLVWASRRARYKMNLQAAVWRKPSLRKVTWGFSENPWQVEILGTWRSWRRPDRYLCPTRKHFGQDSLVPYVGTGGIHRGQWLPYVRELFAENGLEVDFSKRGFYRPQSRALAKWKSFRLIAKSPGAALKAHFLGR